MKDLDASTRSIVPQLDDLLDQLDVSDESLVRQSDILENLRVTLVNDVEHLLVDRRELLLSMLYRIDVDESSVIAAMSQPNSRAIAEKLADLILDRQIMKVRSRRAYRNQSA